MGIRRGGRTTILGLLMPLVLAACCGTRERRPVPEDSLDAAEVSGLPGIRAWGDTPSPVLQRDLVEGMRRLAADETAGPPAYLALSGGAADGAFGAGLLTGWTRTGTRPEFHLVTGISTGALIAPFAFVGPDYDGVLQSVYTSIEADDVYEIRSTLAIPTADSLADSRPLRNLVRRHVNRKLLARVADGHRRGRRLLVGTTNLDAERPVVWNMGAIAASGHPRALALFRDVLVASASIPGAFPPVYLEVDVNGEAHDEMHVDGAVQMQVFLAGGAIDLGAARRELGFDGASPVLYVIRNGKTAPEYRAVEPRLLPIVDRTLYAFLKSQTSGDLFRIFHYAERDGIAFRLASIPEDYRRKWPEEFDRREMKRLFRLGRRLAKAGYEWRTAPPGYSR